MIEIKPPSVVDRGKQRRDGSMVNHKWCGIGEREMLEEIKIERERENEQSMIGDNTCSIRTKVSNREMKSWSTISVSKKNKFEKE